MEEHTKFLAERLLSEERPITYRLLSRALDVHVNTAKEMLYDFHKYQNDLKPASVHATYLVYGSKPAIKAEADGDVEMMSSAPEQDYLTDAVPCTTMTLVAEDKLQDTLSEYADVTSLHVYSLSPQPQKDLTMLSDVAQSMSEYPALDDAAAQAKKYGGIVNPHLRKRTRKNAPPPPTPAAAPAKPIKTEAPKSTAPVATKVKTEPAPSQPKEAAPSQSSKPAVAPKKAAGGIMQSFAKAAAKPPKPKPVKKEDMSMALSDDGEADDEDMPVPANKKSDAEIEVSRQARKNREDELRRMMEEDEDEEEEKEDEDEEMEEPEPEPEAEPAAPVKEEKEPQEVVSSTGDGRRRGKRRVMKKKRILDDQGYMVTIQEEGWESFSEDEAPAKKAAAPTSTPASSAPKSKRPPASSKGSQGSIMSFFGKK
ncbi:hypothetical protein VHEMI10645 [[Torrubiella] hemipterigena]|uniref:DNA polymerase delta subunit 3 n=1 Tax=[Torrubiella] hemipterigena TaxID=1531966 RepID=A0A0A1TTK9_9HYPO|nr:hypothetical protein VHEMI10645 [[Torrubiella] hemipterigena]